MLPLFQQRNLYNNMADVNKIKLQLRSGGVSTNGDKTPSPATKLLLSHGKPNFTIQRSVKMQNGNVQVLAPTSAATNNFQHNNNDVVAKSTTFNGIQFKPSNISVATKQTLPHYGNAVTNSGNDNEAAKVVLRRANVVQTEVREGDVDDENVPEFIRRQRRIQQRLANQNILDFENRRSGYFTQVLISPSSPNRQSFVETMASPAVKPGLEIPPTQLQHEDLKEETIPSEEDHEENESELEKSRDTNLVQSVILNGQVEEEEVAKAIEEVNKAVEGEDDDRTELDQVKFVEPPTEQNITFNILEETKREENGKQQVEVEAEEPANVAAVNQTSQENIAKDVAADSGHALETKIEDSHSNGLAEEEHLENGSLKADKLENGITISHANALSGPCIPPPDPKGEKGVNYEPKTVVSFSQELGNGDNKYPDTVKIVKDAETSESDSELKELTKLKFEINADNHDIEVKPVLKTETA